MKNYFLSALFVGTLILLASCDKDVEGTDLKIDLSRKAPVKGYVYAELNKTSAGLEVVPEGTKIVLSVFYGQFGVAGNGKWVDTVKTDANGVFNASIPVDDNGVILNIEPISFEANQVQEFGANTATKTKIFKAVVAPINLSTSTNDIIVIDYVAKDISTNPIEFASITFTIQAETDNSTTGTEIVPNQEVVLFNTGWMQKYTTDINGKFDASVPVGMAININVSFTLNKKVPDPDNFGQFVNVLFKYENLGGSVGNFTSKGETTVDLGGGAEVK